MLTIPAAIGALSKVADAKEGNPRYAVHGVQLTATADGWEAVATDTTVLILAAGPHTDPTPDCPALASAPNGATSGLVPAKWWAGVCNGAKKARGTRGVNVALSNRVVTAAAAGTTTATEVIDGRFPPVRQFIPKRTDDIGCTVRVDAHRLADTLKAFAALAADPDRAVVTMEIRRRNGPTASDKPLILRLDEHADGVTEAIGLVMPVGCETDPAAKFLGSGDAAPADTARGLDWEILRTDRDRLHDENRTLTDAAAERELQIGQLRVAVEKAERDAAGQSATIDFLRADADRANALLARFKDETEHGNELAGLWGRLGDAERTTRDAVAESERLRAELDALRGERERLLADVDSLRARPVPVATPAPVVYHRPAAVPGVRRTLGQLAAGGA